jgi:hypothetical protein
MKAKRLAGMLIIFHGGFKDENALRSRMRFGKEMENIWSRN